MKSSFDIQVNFNTLLTIQATTNQCCVWQIHHLLKVIDQKNNWINNNLIAACGWSVWIKKNNYHVVLFLVVDM